MSALRGIIAGTVGLALLEVVVSNTQAAGRVGDAFTVISDVLAVWLDPYVPLVPNLTAGQTNPFSGTLPNVADPNNKKPIATDTPPAQNLASAYVMPRLATAAVPQPANA